MEELQDSIVEVRAELMVSPTGDGKPTLRTAHFLKPSVVTEDGPVFEHTLSSLPPTFELKNWPLKLTFTGWRNPPTYWRSWVEKMATLHEPTWKRAGIYEPILNSTYIIKRENDLLLGVAEKWCHETKSFIFPWGEATITLEDVMVCGGYSVLGSPVFSPLEIEELKEIEKKLKSARKETTRSTARKASQQEWMRKFMEKGSEIEHEAFLALWLSRFVFPTSFDVIAERVFSVAIHLARGTRIALAPAVLASIYRDLSLLKGKIVALTDQENFKVGNDENVLATTLRSPFHLVQIWVWERFIELRPKPNLIKASEPRLAQWHQLASKVGNVRLILDSAKETFDWRPYAKTLENWKFPKFFGEMDRWVLVDSGVDEESLSFAQCLRVSELVGLDCMQQYLPHRVAMQFGMDQDLPGFVARCNKAFEIAWSNYSKPISDGKLYIPSRFFEADVTTRYLEWRKRSVSVLTAASEADVTMPKIPKEKNEGNSSKQSEVAKKILKENSGGISGLKITTDKAKGGKEGANSPICRVTPKRSEGTKAGEGLSGSKITAKSSNRMKEVESLASSDAKEKSSEGMKEGGSASIHVDVPPGNSKTPRKISKRKKESNNVGTTLGLDSPFKRLTISEQSPRRKKDDKDVYASPDFPLKGSKRSAKNSKAVKHGKASILHYFPVKEAKNSKKDTEVKKEGNDFSVAHTFPFKCSKESAETLEVKKEENDDVGYPNNPQKFPLNLRGVNDSLVPPGFSPKRNQLSVSELLRSTIENGAAQNRQWSDNKCSLHRPSSMSDREMVENLESRKRVEEKFLQSEAAIQAYDSAVNFPDNIEAAGSPNQNTVSTNGNENVNLTKGVDGRNLSIRSRSSSSSIAVDNMDLVKLTVEHMQTESMATGLEKTTKNANGSNAGTPANISINSDGVGGNGYIFELPGLELEARISRLERLVADLKAARTVTSA